MECDRKKCLCTSAKYKRISHNVYLTKNKLCKIRANLQETKNRSQLFFRFFFSLLFYKAQCWYYINHTYCCTLMIIARFPCVSKCGNKHQVCPFLLIIKSYLRQRTRRTVCSLYYAIDVNVPGEQSRCGGRAVSIIQRT